MCSSDLNKRAVLPDAELFTERLRAMLHFADNGGIDVWGRWWRERLGELEAEFRDAVQRSYRGPAADKYDVLSRYRFAVCYENMVLRGWITEKIFDCLYAGTIPIYLGAPDITDYVPSECFIDRRAFPNYDELSRFLASLGSRDLERYRQAGRDYFRSGSFQPFTATAFADRFLADIEAHLRERGLGHLWG